MEQDNIIEEKSFRFAVRIIKLYQFLQETKREFILSKQLLKSGTSIGANISKALQGISKKDFVAKMSISLKEAQETHYWLRLLKETGYLSIEQFESIENDLVELIKI